MATIHTERQELRRAVGDPPVITKTASYTALPTDGTILCDASGGAFTITLPPTVENPGKVYNIVKIDSSINIVTIQGDGAETFELTIEDESDTLVSVPPNWRIQ